MPETQTAPADFVVLHTDGRVEYGSAEPGRRVRDSIAAHIPNLATQGHGRFRMWFADDFSAPGLYTNPLADKVIGRLGYPYSWHGPVALTMEEAAPLEADIRATVTELADELTAGMFTAAERYAPELLEDLMYMSSLTHNGRTVYQYKHCWTRRYLNLDLTGQAWWFGSTENGQLLARPLDLFAAKEFVKLLDAPEDLEDES